MNTPAGRIGALIRILIWALVAVILSALLVFLFVRGSFSMDFSFFGLSAYSYSNEKSYHVGQATVSDNFNSIDIDWISGSVELLASSTETVSIQESGQGSEEKDALRWKVENGTLFIKYSAPRSLFMKKTPKKDLTLSLPKSLLSKLDRVGIESVSAPISLPSELGAREINLESVSGGVETGILSADSLDIETVSGKIQCKGEISNLDLNSVSGRIDFAGSAREADAESVSGEIDLNLEDDTKTLDLKTVSGDLTVAVSEKNSGVTVDFETVSGSFNSEFESYAKGKGHYVIGNGDIQLNAETVSGDLSIEKKR